VLTTKGAAEAVVAWAGEVLEIGTGSQAAYPQAGKFHELPDVAAVVQHRAQREGGDEHYFPFADLQETWLVIYVLEVSVMVEVEGKDEASAKAAHEYLEQATDALADAIYDDATLSGHLTGKQMASPTFTVDLSSPFIEYDDGTRGRAFFASMAVAEARDEPGF
jgi:hypothetical protein